jgi:hypothetical protein
VVVLDRDLDGSVARGQAERTPRDDALAPPPSRPARDRRAAALGPGAIARRVARALRAVVVGDRVERCRARRRRPSLHGLCRDHELVTSGPYAIVRHPIYTGLVLAFVGSAITLGEMRGVLAVVIVVASLWRKLRLEERWMAEQFGDDYERYRDRVRALVPFVL